MTDLLPYAGSVGTTNPTLDLFRVPPTDLSYQMIPIQTFLTGINPVEFQVDPQEDYVDLSCSYLELELTLKNNDANNVAAANNLRYVQD